MKTRTRRGVAAGLTALLLALFLGNESFAQDVPGHQPVSDTARTGAMTTASFEPQQRVATHGGRPEAQADRKSSQSALMQKTIWIAVGGVVVVAMILVVIFWGIRPRRRRGQIQESQARYGPEGATRSAYFQKPGAPQAESPYSEFHELVGAINRLTNCINGLGDMVQNMSTVLGEMSTKVGSLSERVEQTLNPDRTREVGRAILAEGIRGLTSVLEETSARLRREGEAGVAAGEGRPGAVAPRRGPEPLNEDNLKGWWREHGQEGLANCQRSLEERFGRVTVDVIARREGAADEWTIMVVSDGHGNHFVIPRRHARWWSRLNPPASPFDGWFDPGRGRPVDAATITEVVSFARAARVGTGWRLISRGEVHCSHYA